MEFPVIAVSSGSPPKLLAWAFPKVWCFGFVTVVCKEGKSVLHLISQLLACRSGWFRSPLSWRSIRGKYPVVCGLDLRIWGAGVRWPLFSFLNCLFFSLSYVRLFGEKKLSQWESLEIDTPTYSSSRHQFWHYDIGFIITAMVVVILLNHFRLMHRHRDLSPLNDFPKNRRTRSPVSIVQFWTQLT